MNFISLICPIKCIEICLNFLSCDGFIFLVTILLVLWGHTVVLLPAPVELSIMMSCIDALYIMSITLLTYIHCILTVCYFVIYTCAPPAPATPLYLSL